MAAGTDAVVAVDIEQEHRSLSSIPSRNVLNSLVVMSRASMTRMDLDVMSRAS